MLSLFSAGLTALNSLALIGCMMTVSVPDLALARLQQLSELELCNGSLTSPTPAVQMVRRSCHVVHFTP